MMLIIVPYEVFQWTFKGTCLKSKVEQIGVSSDVGWSDFTSSYAPFAFATRCT